MTARKRIRQRDLADIGQRVLDDIKRLEKEQDDLERAMAMVQIRKSCLDKSICTLREFKRIVESEEWEP